MKEEQVYLSVVPYPRLIDDMRTLMQVEIQNALSTLIKTEAEPTEELLTVREVSIRLSVCPQTVHEYKRQGIFPFYKISGRTYLKWAEVVAALQGNQRTTKGGKGINHG